MSVFNNVIFGTLSFMFECKSNEIQFAKMKIDIIRTPFKIYAISLQIHTGPTNEMSNERRNINPPANARVRIALKSALPIEAFSNPLLRTSSFQNFSSRR